ncbi:hypothetical protein RB4951 [Rhodopirellula baltica SH 1]|uniref:Uncharacterized protein n=1 Tax=Rhodopirellula baltica (strain DSM 10527 / NCIMB 13988 / SH1) TaxID=243090 RepID=Q7UGY3_RHOBA|nr:hypothetical protein RB4951 [Rhodopirellula baltica SH 1]
MRILARICCSPRIPPSLSGQRDRHSLATPPWWVTSCVRRFPFGPRSFPSSIRKLSTGADFQRLTRTRWSLREELENGLACFAAQAFRRYHSSNFS